MTAPAHDCRVDEGAFQAIRGKYDSLISPSVLRGLIEAYLSAANPTEPAGDDMGDARKGAIGRAIPDTDDSSAPTPSSTNQPSGMLDNEAELRTKLCNWFSLSTATAQDAVELADSCFFLIRPYLRQPVQASEQPDGWTKSAIHMAKVVQKAWDKKELIPEGAATYLASYVMNITSRPMVRESGHPKLSACYVALRRLVDLKKHKDEKGKDAFYEGDQPAAWRRARSAINDIEGELSSGGNI